MARQFLSPIHRSSRQIGIYLQTRMDRLGLANPEGHTLSYLRAYGPCPVGELHQVFGFKRSTLTSMLDRLGDRGYVTREIDPADRRSIIVGLTRGGKSAGDSINREVEELERAIGRRVKRADLDGFQKVMEAIEAATAVKIRGGRGR